MQEFIDITVVGVDARRPPRVRKEPYIDLFFELSRQAPQDWCEDFNRLTDRLDPKIMINKGEGLFIDTYVRDMEHIPAHLENIKQKVAACNGQYRENLRQLAARADSGIASLAGEGGAQGKLNSIIADLHFGAADA